MLKDLSGSTSLRLWRRLFVTELIHRFNYLCVRPLSVSSVAFWQEIGFNIKTLTLTLPQMVARCVTGALAAYYPENIIFKGLINMYKSSSPQTGRAALFPSTGTVTVPWREHGYEMPHWIWALCWDTGVARLGGNYSIMKKRKKKKTSSLWPV